VDVIWSNFAPTPVVVLPTQKTPKIFIRYQGLFDHRVGPIFDSSKICYGGLLNRSSHRRDEMRLEISLLCWCFDSLLTL
jgi:hypothetical protein